jgi:arylsulfatase
MLSRRRWLASSLGLPAAAPAPRRPNILVFMTDQESALLPGPAKLPNRGRLRRGAAVFTHAFCNTPQCSPARAALLTGLEPHRVGVRTNVDGGSLGVPLDPKIPTIGSVFANAGYATGYFGKWHLTNEKKTPLSEFGWRHRADGTDAEMASAAADWIREQKGPWIAWVSVLDPHHIYDVAGKLANPFIRAGVQTPRSGLDNLDAKPPEQRAFVDNDQGRATAKFTPEDWRKYREFYLSLVEKTDAYLGQLLDAAALFDDTVVAYTSDHGDALGEHGLPFKGPFMYEELIRVPLLIQAPGRLKAGVRDDLVTQADLAPTLAALAGLAWHAKTDGQSLVQPVRRDAVFLEYYSKQKWVNPIQTIRTRRHKLNAYESGHRELYDLQADPAETRNLAVSPAYAALRKSLEQRLATWWNSKT